MTLPTDTDTEKVIMLITKASLIKYSMRPALGREILGRLVKRRRREGGEEKGIIIKTGKSEKNRYFGRKKKVNDWRAACIKKKFKKSTNVLIISGPS